MQERTVQFSDEEEILDLRTAVVVKFIAKTTS